MDEPFCRLASNQLRFENDLISPCCWISKKVSIDSEDVDQYIHWLKNINDWVPECSYCKNLEDRGIESGRLQRKQDFRFFNHFNISKTDLPGEVTSLEIQISEDCNAACLMCSEQNSSTWKKYNAKNDHLLKIKIDQDTKSKTERRLEFIIKTVDFSKLKYITFLGGEPLKNDDHFKILKKIKEVNDFKDVVINYVTNGSYFPSDDILNFWKESKLVKINLSIDGIGDHFEYLRWPLQWKQVEKNIDKFFHLDKEKFFVTTSYAVSPFNIFYHDRYVEWANSKDYKYAFNHPFEASGTINLTCVPIKLHHVLTEKYQDTFPNLLKLIRPFNFGNYKRFMEFVKHHDQRRNLDWRKSFPEVSDFFLDI